MPSLASLCTTCAWAESEVNADLSATARGTQLVHNQASDGMAARRLELGTGGVAVILDEDQELQNSGVALAALLSRTALQVHVPKAEIAGILEILDLRARTDELLRHASDK